MSKARRAAVAYIRDTPYKKNVVIDPTFCLSFHMLPPRAPSLPGGIGATHSLTGMQREALHVPSLVEYSNWGEIWLGSYQVALDPRF